MYRYFEFSIYIGNSCPLNLFFIILIMLMHKFTYSKDTLFYCLFTYKITLIENDLSSAFIKNLKRRKEKIGEL